MPVRFVHVFTAIRATGVVEVFIDRMRRVPDKAYLNILALPIGNFWNQSGVFRLRSLKYDVEPMKGRFQARVQRYEGTDMYIVILEIENQLFATVAYSFLSLIGSPSTKLKAQSSMFSQFITLPAVCAISRSDNHIITHARNYIVSPSQIYRCGIAFIIALFQLCFLISLPDLRFLLHASFLISEPS